MGVPSMISFFIKEVTVSQFS